MACFVKISQFRSKKSNFRAQPEYKNDDFFSRNSYFNAKMALLCLNISIEAKKSMSVQNIIFIPKCPIFRKMVNLNLKLKFWVGKIRFILGYRVFTLNNSLRLTIQRQ